MANYWNGSRIFVLSRKKVHKKSIFPLSWLFLDFFSFSIVNSFLTFLRTIEIFYLMKKKLVKASPLGL